MGGWRKAAWEGAVTMAGTKVGMKTDKTDKMRVTMGGVGVAEVKRRGGNGAGETVVSVVNVETVLTVETGETVETVVSVVSVVTVETVETVVTVVSVVNVVVVGGGAVRTCTIGRFLS